MLKTYWQQFNDRERFMVGVGITACALYLFYLLVYAPLTSAVHLQTQQWLEKQDTLAWMQQARGLKHKRPATTLTHTQLLTVLAKALKKTSFQTFPYELQQTGSKEAQLTYERVPFNPFFKWLWSMHTRHGIVIQSFNLQRTDTPGVVKLQAVIAVQ